MKNPTAQLGNWAFRNRLRNSALHGYFSSWLFLLSLQFSSPELGTLSIGAQVLTDTIGDGIVDSEKLLDAGIGADGAAYPNGPSQRFCSMRVLWTWPSTIFV